MTDEVRPLVAVLDYGIGNLRSAQKALERVGADARLTADSGLIADAIITKLQPWYNPTWLHVTPAGSVRIDICGMVVIISLSDSSESKLYSGREYVATLIDAWDNNHPEATREHIEKILNGWTRDDKGNLHPPANHATDS